jgi:hypothetical protein
MSLPSTHKCNAQALARPERAQPCSRWSWLVSEVRRWLFGIVTVQWSPLLDSNQVRLAFDLARLICRHFPADKAEVQNFIWIIGAYVENSVVEVV